MPLGSNFNVHLETQVLVAMYQDGGEFAKYKSWFYFIKGNVIHSYIEDHARFLKSAQKSTASCTCAPYREVNYSVTRWADFTTSPPLPVFKKIAFEMEGFEDLTDMDEFEMKEILDMERVFCNELACELLEGGACFEASVPHKDGDCCGMCAVDE